MSLEPNTFIKLSEFGVNGQEWNYSENANIIYELIDFFSPERCMFASNFPVSKLKITLMIYSIIIKKLLKNSQQVKNKLFFLKQLLKHIISRTSFLISNELSKRI